MAVNVVMPMLGLTMTEGAIRKWWKQEGERVEKGTPLLEVETDKALVDVEAPEEGWLRRVLAEAGRVVPVGTIVGVIGGEREDISMTMDKNAAGVAPQAGGSAPPGAESPQVAHASGPMLISPRARRLAEEHQIDWKNLEGTGQEGRITEKDVELRIAQTPASPQNR